MTSSEVSGASEARGWVLVGGGTKARNTICGGWERGTEGAGVVGSVALEALELAGDCCGSWVGIWARGEAEEGECIISDMEEAEDSGSVGIVIGCRVVGEGN